MGILARSEALLLVGEAGAAVKLQGEGRPFAPEYDDEDGEEQEGNHCALSVAGLLPDSANLSIGQLDTDSP